MDEVKSLRDKAAALKAYARQAKNKQLEIDAAEIRIRAERRLGELLKEQPKNPGTRTEGGGKGAGGSIKEPPAIPTHADLGIDKKLSMRSQQLGNPCQKKETIPLANSRMNHLSLLAMDKSLCMKAYDFS